MNVCVSESAFNSSFYTVTYVNKTEFVDPLIFLYRIEENIISRISEALAKFKSIKVMLVLSLDAYKNEENLEFSVKSKATPVFQESDLTDLLTELFMSLIYELLAFSFCGSGWSIQSPKSLDLHINKYSPLKIGCFINLPAKISKRRSLQNIRSKKTDCFKLCILASYLKTNSSIKQILAQDHIDFSMCSEPMQINKLSKFEIENSLAVNVFAYENGKFYPLRVSKYVNSQDHRIHDLLVLQRGSQNHFVNIRNLNSLLRPQLTKRKNRIFVCRTCFSHHSSEARYREHVTNFCCQDKPHRAIFPKPNPLNPPATKFNQWKNTEKIPFALSWDSESVLLDQPLVEFDPNKPATVCVEKHEIIAISCLVMTYLEPRFCGDIPLTVQTFVGSNAADQFIYFLNELEPKILNVLNKNVPLVMTSADQASFLAATECELCKTPFGEDRNLVHKDHNHHTGAYRAALCQRCNMQRKVIKTVPLFSHNGSKYDNCLILRSLHKLGLGQIRVLQKGSLENFLYIRVTTGNGLVYQFQDSCRIFSASLNSIIETLPTDVLDQLDGIFGPEYAKFAKQKGVYPYSYCKSEQELRECISPPPQEAFYSNLSGCSLSDEDYARFKDTWSGLKCRNLMQYLIFYLHTDVILLALFLKYYRQIVYEQFGLGLFHYISLPQLSWSQALKFTGSSIEQITCPDIFFAMKRYLKGGLVTCSRSVAVANNPYCKNYDPEKLKKFIVQLDMNGLYASVLCFRLPSANYTFDNNLEKYNEDYILHWHLDLNEGCFLFVDIHMSNKLHDYYNDLPLLSTREKVGAKQENRLILTLKSQKNYFCHIYMLQMLLKYGLKLVRVRKVIRFTQTRVFQPYIEHCIKKRQQTNSKTISDYLKLCSNALYGRSIFTPNSTDVRLYCCPLKAQKQINKFNFRERIIYSQNLVSIVLNKKSVRHTSSLLIGNTVLELSKVVLYSYYYEHLKVIFPDSLCLYSDTDSVTLCVVCDSIFEAYQKSCVIETSNFPPDHLYYSPENKKRAGFMEDEGCGRIVKIFIGLTNKTYCISYNEGSNKIRSKGIPKKVNLREKDYINCLITNQQKYMQFYRIDRRRLNLRTLLVNRLSLSTLNDKRHFTNGSEESFAPGHFRLQFENYNVPQIILSKLYECLNISD